MENGSAVTVFFPYFLQLSSLELFCTENSERAFYKELVKVIEASDVIVEVLDARDPLGTRCVDMERMVLKSGADKHLVLLLNKIGNDSLSHAHTNHHHTHIHRGRD